MNTGFITLGDLGLVEDAAQEYQGSYWPNEPPVFAPKGFYWYDYGPVGRGMHFWKTLPIGRRPSASEQQADLEKHRKEFAWGRVPAGLVEALAQHGLSLERDQASKWLGNFVAVAFVWMGLSVLGRLVIGKR